MECAGPVARLSKRLFGRKRSFFGGRFGSTIQGHFMREQIQEFDASPRQRRLAAEFLARLFAVQGGGDAAQWMRRMAHWWEANPAAADHPVRGWFMGDDDAVHAFSGAIPFRYRVGDERVTGLAGTSWAMDPSVRSSAIAMAMHLQRSGEKAVLLATTPSLEVRSMLRKGGWVEHPHHERLVLPALPLVRRCFMRPGRAEGNAFRLTWGVQEVAEVAERPLPAGILHRETSVEFLRWYLDSPAREHHFAGWIDSGGTLVAHVIVAPATIRRQGAWEVVDARSSDAACPVLGLVEALLGRLPIRPWLILNRLGGGVDSEWPTVRPLRVSQPEPTLFFRAPAFLDVAGKVWQMAEGDLGL